MSLHPSRLVRSITLALRRLGRNSAQGLGQVATLRAGRAVLAVGVLVAAGAGAGSGVVVITSGSGAAPKFASSSVIGPVASGGGVR